MSKRCLARSTAAVGSLFAVAAIASAVAFANAPLPDPVDPTIVPGRSLGGVSIGQPMAEAEAAWGRTLNCKNEKQVRSCNYNTRKRGFGDLFGNADGVYGASINAPAKNGEFAFRGPLMEFGTEKGDLGLGDKLRRVAKRYPEGELDGWSLTFREGDTRMLFFSGDKKTRRVTGIVLGPLRP